MKKLTKAMSIWNQLTEVQTPTTLARRMTFQSLSQTITMTAWNQSPIVSKKKKDSNDNPSKQRKMQQHTKRKESFRKPAKHLQVNPHLKSYD